MEHRLLEYVVMVGAVVQSRVGKGSESFELGMHRLRQKVLMIVLYSGEHLMCKKTL